MTNLANWTDEKARKLAEEIVTEILWMRENLDEDLNESDCCAVIEDLFGRYGILKRGTWATYPNGK